MQEVIYLDNAATTATRPEVVEAMLPYFTQHYGNPSTIYSLGQESHAAVDHAREVIAKSLGAKPEEIYFTAGGSESRAKSSITPCCTPASIWSSRALR